MGRIDKQILRTEQAVAGLYMEMNGRFDELEAAMHELGHELLAETGKERRG